MVIFTDTIADGLNYFFKFDVHNTWNNLKQFETILFELILFSQDIAVTCTNNRTEKKLHFSIFASVFE